uniref:Macaca fascicularis brain cDNA clone: QflA-19129, similar to human myocilin, trabecular meshwork inducible glucocorticoidresponse (MYOC), mRNA, RefSeq: NM_000261.1 n=1 Tax=Macaca fascicularis TaxID=9541 RepID=I7GCE6_MACFA|nr:unnamed protein product [Macaca fascicularis]
MVCGCEIPSPPTPTPGRPHGELTQLAQMSARFLSMTSSASLCRATLLRFTYCPGHWKAPVLWCTRGASISRALSPELS